MRKTLNKILMMATLVPRNANEAIIAPMVECGSLRLAEVWSQAAAFMVVCLAGIGLNRCEDVFTFDLDHEEILCIL
jgi:hypothetical protein